MGGARGAGTQEREGGREREREREREAFVQNLWVNRLLLSSAILRKIRHSYRLDNSCFGPNQRWGLSRMLSIRSLRCCPQDTDAPVRRDRKCDPKTRFSTCSSKCIVYSTHALCISSSRMFLVSQMISSCLRMRRRKPSDTVPNFPLNASLIEIPHNFSSILEKPLAGFTGRP